MQKVSAFHSGLGGPHFQVCQKVTCRRTEFDTWLHYVQASIMYQVHSLHLKQSWHSDITWCPGAIEIYLKRGTYWNFALKWNSSKETLSFYELECWTHKYSIDWYNPLDAPFNWRVNSVNVTLDWLKDSWPHESNACLRFNKQTVRAIFTLRCPWWEIMCLKQDNNVLFHCLLNSHTRTIYNWNGNCCLAWLTQASPIIFLLTIIAKYNSSEFISAIER